MPGSERGRPEIGRRDTREAKAHTLPPHNKGKSNVSARSSGPSQPSCIATVRSSGGRGRFPTLPRDSEVGVGTKLARMQAGVGTKLAQCRGRDLAVFPARFPVMAVRVARGKCPAAAINRVSANLAPGVPCARVCVCAYHNSDISVVRLCDALHRAGVMPCSRCARSECFQ